MKEKIKTEKYLKHICVILLASVLLLGSSFVAGAAPLNDVEINAVNFPDEKFRDFVKQYDDNSDDWLDTDELAAVTDMDLFDEHITDLKGIEYFTALTKLNCVNNRLSTLDVSRNTALTELDCGFNRLIKLDVSGNTALTKLYCGFNQLIELDVSENTALTVLDCNENQLNTLDISANTALESLVCNENQLSALYISTNAALKHLVCYSNQLNALDIRANTALKNLACGGNQLSELDVSANTALERFACNDNRLSELDIRANTALIELVCHGNQLSELAISAVPAIRNAVLNGMKEDSDPDFDHYLSSEGELYVDKPVTILTEAPASFTVSFDVKGHGTAPATQTVISGGTATAPAAPSESGWTFGGWYKEADCVNAFDFTAPITADTVAYAKWTKASSGGSGGSGGGGGSSGGGSSRRGAGGAGGPARNTASGSWKQDAKGWWYQYGSGSYPKGEWKELPYSGGNAWYAFDETGYMRTGWFFFGGHGYYLSTANDTTLGKMLTGWQQIDGKWYCLELTGNSSHPQGAMYANERTPDGYTVNEKGEWVK